MIQLFFVMRGVETIENLKVSNLEKVVSDDLQLEYFRLKKGSTKNHQDDIEICEGGKIL